MRISSNFDSGNIHVIRAEDPQDIQLTIQRDNQSDFYQWFHFKLETQSFITHKMTISDLKKSAYPDGWENYQAVASYDRQEWFRIDCEFDGENLVIEHIRCCDWCFGGIEFGKGYFAVSINKGLLIDTTNTF